MGQRRPTVSDVRGWVRDWYERNPVGGVLHIVLDDYNVGDADVEWCMEQAHERGNTEGERLAQTLLYMTATQRRKLAYNTHRAIR